MNSSKLSGYIFIVIGAIIALLAALWAMINSDLGGSARVLTIAIGVVLGLPLVGVGLYLLNKGTSEASEEKTIAKQRKLLNLVLTKGQVELREVAIEMDVSRDEARQLIKDLVGKQLFSGYIDWDAGVLYSVEASKMKDGKCPKCGGQLQLAGKGLVKCQYCGSEVFLS
jgi:DNA-directed RNA polymerase subunit RPC12/RpoP